jgi:hypothetical protein
MPELESKRHLLEVAAVKAESNKGKRILRSPLGGIITFGEQRAPVRIYEGPTDRLTIKSNAAAALAAGSEAEGSLIKANLPSGEGNSLGNANRGDRI